jgi:MinD-like ATPase involved in chromosome partitioning or flagellar assembly
MGRLSSQLSSASLALIGNATAQLHALRESDEILRKPLPLSRRIGFVQARGGSGASSTAAYVSSVFARRRGGMVLGVNASASYVNLGWYTGTRGSSQRVSDLRGRARNAAEAVDGLPTSGSGLYTFDLREAESVRGPVSGKTWSEQLGPITRFFDVVSTDWGTRGFREDFEQVAGTSHAICLVSRADRHAVEEAAALIPALSALEDSPRVVLVTVDVGRTGGRAASIAADNLDIPVLQIPYDSARASAKPVSSSALSTKTRIAYTTLATTLMSEVQA